jgi:signal transduction histidine kinase
MGALHDVSNALTVLLGWADEARQPEASGATREYALAIITDEAQRARELARLMIGASADVEASRVDDTVRRIVLALERERTRKQVHFELALMAGEVRVDGSAFGQIAQNLLLNALSFAPPDSSIYVSTSQEGAEFTLRVRDEGPGVPRVDFRGRFNSKRWKRCGAAPRAGAGDNARWNFGTRPV